MSDQPQRRIVQQAEDRMPPMTRLVNNLIFHSSRVWKSHTPDQFDFTYTRILLHTGELLKRLSENTAYDILAGIEMSPHSDHIQNTGSTIEGKYIQITLDIQNERGTDVILPETYPERSSPLNEVGSADSEGRSSTVNSSDLDCDTAPQKVPVHSQEWFSHLLVQRFVNKQLEDMELYNDDLIRFEEITKQHDNAKEIYKTIPSNNNVIQDDSLRLDQISDVIPQPSSYNNPFGVKSLFPDVTFSGADIQTMTTCSWLDTLVGLVGPNEMKSVEPASVSKTYEDHLQKYRSLLHNLTIEAALKEPVTVLPPAGTPQLHKNGILPLEVLRMDKLIPIDWHHLSTSELVYMRRVLTSSVRELWKDAVSRDQAAAFRRQSGSFRRPNDTERHHTELHGSKQHSADETDRPGDVSVPSFRRLKPTNCPSPFVNPTKNECPNVTCVATKPEMASSTNQRPAHVINPTHQEVTTADKTPELRSTAVMSVHSSVDPSIVSVVDSTSFTERPLACGRHSSLRTFSSPGLSGIVSSSHLETSESGLPRGSQPNALTRITNQMSYLQMMLDCCTSQQPQLPPPPSPPSAPPLQQRQPHPQLKQPSQQQRAEVLLKRPPQPPPTLETPGFGSVDLHYATDACYGALPYDGATLSCRFQQPLVEGCWTVVGQRVPDLYGDVLSTMCTTTLTTQTQPINTVCGKNAAVWHRTPGRPDHRDPLYVRHSSSYLAVQPVHDLVLTNTAIQNQRLIQQHIEQQQQQYRLLQCLQQHLHHYPTL